MNIYTPGYTAETSTVEIVTISDRRMVCIRASGAAIYMTISEATSLAADLLDAAHAAQPNESREATS